MARKIIKKTGAEPIKTVKVKKPKRVPVPKTRNNGTMTEAAFWGWIRQWMRKRSLGWKPISQCKADSKRPYKGPNKRQRFEYRCNKCKKYHAGKDVQVDHVIPAGSLRSASDLNSFISMLFCEINNLQVLCTKCHDVKTAADKAALKLKRENEHK